jgi:Protein of unknown function (DUF3011)
MHVYRIGFVLLGTLLTFLGPVGAQTIHCSSDDGLRKYCQADTRNGAHLVKQLSDAPCKQNASWGFDEKGVWVDHGCGGDFAMGAETAGQGGAKIITCSSDGGRKYCDAGTGHGVRLVKQRGDAPCKQDKSWGYDGLGIWVDQGCSGDFALGNPSPARLAATGDNSGTDSGDDESTKRAKDRTCLKEVGRARADQMVKQCLQVSAATHPPCNSQNSCELIDDEIRRSCGMLGRDAPAFCGGYK